MALIDIDRSPSKKTLLLFGALLGVFLAGVGAVLRWQFDAPRTARVLWVLALLLPAAYYLVPPWRRAIYLGWTYAFFPVGWLISHLLLGALYYLVLTPIGLVMRLVGRDPMHRRWDSGAPSYWVEYEARSNADADGYFRQF